MFMIGLNDVWKWTKRIVLMAVLIRILFYVAADIYYRSVEHYIIFYVPEFDMYYKCSFCGRSYDDNFYLSMSKDPLELKRSSTPPKDEIDYVYTHMWEFAHMTVFYKTSQMDTLRTLTFKGNNHSRNIPMYSLEEVPWPCHNTRQYPGLEIEYNKFLESLLITPTKDVTVEYVAKKHFRKENIHLIDIDSRVKKPIQ